MKQEGKKVRERNTDESIHNEEKKQRWRMLRMERDVCAMEKGVKNERRTEKQEKERLKCCTGIKKK